MKMIRTNLELHYTGHPFVDVGLATIAGFGTRSKPLDAITIDHLTEVAQYLKRIYCTYKPVQNYISVIFTNSPLAQFAMKQADKEAYANEVLFAFQNDHPAIEGEEHCVFFPQLAAVMRATRQHIPLLNGVEVSNFSAIGTRGVPVSGLALLAIHAMPLGCYKCGHLLAFHQLQRMDDQSDINRVLARMALGETQKYIAMMSPDSAEGGMPSYGNHVRTRYVEQLLRAKNEAGDRSASIDNITGYYFTNYGPSPRLEIVRLDNAVLRFINLAQQDFVTAWGRVTRAGWERPKGEENTSPDHGNTVTWRNRAYETLFRLPHEAHKFIWMLGSGGEWGLIALFLEKVMNMERERIETYRELGDRLARYVIDYENGSPGFYYQFRREQHYDKLRRRLFSAAERVWKRTQQEGGQPLFTYDEFIAAFEHPADTYHQWRLARDLVAIRMLEMLHGKIDVSELPEIPEEESDDEQD
jgi:CRISPR-associated protein Cst1